MIWNQLNAVFIELYTYTCVRKYKCVCAKVNMYVNYYIEMYMAHRLRLSNELVSISDERWAWYGHMNGEIKLVKLEWS